MPNESTTAAASGVGPTVEIARASTGKPIFFGLMHWLAAVLLGLPGGVLVMITLTEEQTDGTIAMFFMGLAFLLAALLYLLAGLRRLRLAGDKRLFVRAGPGGIEMCVPSNRGMAGFFRTAYPLKTFSMKWSEITRWYPFRHTLNGMPTQTTVRFEGLPDWRVTVDLGHFASSQKKLVEAISSAIVRTDL